jgi:hypothetical protein
MLLHAIHVPATQADPHLVALHVARAFSSGVHELSLRLWMKSTFGGWYNLISVGIQHTVSHA